MVSFATTLDATFYDVLDELKVVGARLPQLIGKIEQINQKPIDQPEFEVTVEHTYRVIESFKDFRQIGGG